MGSAAYWKRIARRAWTNTTTGHQHWKAHIGFRAGAAFIFGTVVFFATLGKDKVMEELQVWAAYTLAAGAALFIWELIRNFFRAPAEMEREAKQTAQAQIDELRERLEQLEDKRSQVLHFDFRPEDNKYLENLESGWIGRVAVKNTSETDAVLNLKTKLVHYWADGVPSYHTLDINLSSYSTDTQTEDVPSRGNVTYNLFRVDGVGRNRTLSLGPRADGSYEVIPLGRYRLKITAFQTNGPRLAQWFLLDVKDSGKPEYRPWKPGDSVHELKKISSA